MIFFIYWGYFYINKISLLQIFSYPRKFQNMKKENTYKFPQMLGQYRLLKLIGKGGMGEIFLAEDPICERKVALKKILPKLVKYPSIKNRFLHEAKIAAQLTHPSIIAIYSLHVEASQIYYTMPYIEGETLKHILKTTRQGEKNGESPHPIGSSIPLLMRIFLNICQAVDYTHSNGFLHRDLKPENIMVGKFGEVTILDWGIAHRIGEQKEEGDPISETSTDPNLTKPGKVVGTVTYMAPERALKHPSSVKTDIYSLGIMLYQILSLRLPFTRRSLSEFRKNMHLESWIEPQEMAPYRDIPLQLSLLTKKCMHPNPARRMESVHQMIADLEHYIEGRPEWIPTSKLHINHFQDWEFQENVPLAKHMAISKISGEIEWVMLMVSKESYSGNTRLEATLSLSSSSFGIGFLMCIPNANERKGLEEGYLMWIGSKNHPTCTLFRSNVEVMATPEMSLNPNQTYSICLEKVDNHFRLSIDGVSVLNYFSHIPLIGGHIGLLSRDADYTLETIDISLGSQNVMVNCLSIPDAFFTSKDYSKALSEYSRIAHSFKGRAEGREAVFRTGLTLLEQKKLAKTTRSKKELFQKALDTFESLRHSPGAPLEYLGKSLVYQSEEDIDEEIKCLELAIRRYANHPLLTQIEDHISYRLHETSTNDRRGVYSFALLALRHLPKILESSETERLMTNLISNWETLTFIEKPTTFLSKRAKQTHFAIEIAFRLSKPTVLYEISQMLEKKWEETPTLLANTLFALLEMDYFKLTDFILQKLEQQLSDTWFLLLKNLVEIAIQHEKQPLSAKLDLFFKACQYKTLSQIEKRLLSYLFNKGANCKQAKEILPYFPKVDEEMLLPLYIKTLLFAENIDEAGKLLKTMCKKEGANLTSPYHTLYGCFLTLSKGEKKGLAHFQKSFETRFPPTTSLLSYYLRGHINLQGAWTNTAFSFEKIALFKDLSLYYFCLGKKRKALDFEEMVEKEQLKDQMPLNFL